MSASSLAVLSRCFAIGLCSALRFCCGALPSVYARPCGSVAVFCLRFTPGLAVLLRCFVIGFARHHGSVAALCHRFTPGLAVLLRCFVIGLRSALWFCCGVLPSVHACLFHVVKKRRLAMCSVPIPQGRDRHSGVLVPFWGYLPLWVHFGFVRFFSWRSRRVTGGRRNEERRTGLAARSLCALMQPHWLCCVFRGEVRWG